MEAVLEKEAVAARLVEAGFGRLESIAATNATSGSVESAAALLLAAPELELELVGEPWSTIRPALEVCAAVSQVTRTAARVAAAAASSGRLRECTRTRPITIAFGGAAGGFILWK